MAHCFLFCSSCSRMSSSRRAKERTIQYLEIGGHIMSSIKSLSLLVNLLEPGKTCYNIPSLKKTWQIISKSLVFHLDSKGGKQSRDDKDKKDPNERWRWYQPSQFAFGFLRFGLAWVRSQGGQLEERGEGHPGSAAQCNITKWQCYTMQYHKISAKLYVTSENPIFTHTITHFLYPFTITPIDAKSNLPEVV